ncbi:hypothetical protein ACLOJK_006572, partial [Asimina triloba]
TLPEYRFRYSMFPNNPPSDPLPARLRSIDRSRSENPPLRDDQQGPAMSNTSSLFYNAGQPSTHQQRRHVQLQQIQRPPITSQCLDPAASHNRTHHHSLLHVSVQCRPASAHSSLARRQICPYQSTITWHAFVQQFVQHPFDRRSRRQAKQAIVISMVNRRRLMRPKSKQNSAD